MKALLFLLGISYFFIFFLVHQKGINSSFISLFWQAQIYFLVSILTIFYTFEMKNFSKKNTQTSLISFDFKEMFIAFRDFFKKRIYFLGLILLYVSFYFIFRGFYEDIYIGTFFVILNIGTLLLYIIFKKLDIFHDLLRGNTIIISFFYSFTHILFFLEQTVTFIDLEKEFPWQDIVNMLFIAISFILLFLSKRSIKHISYIASHGIIFFLLEIFLFFHFFLLNDFLLLFINMTLFGVIVVFFLLPDTLSKKSYIPLKFFLIWGNILSYLLILLSLFIVFSTISISFIIQSFISCIVGFLLYMYYKEFGNILSLFFAIFSFLIVVFSTIFQISGKEKFIILLPFLFLIFSSIIFIFPILKKYIYEKELYILQFTFIGINIIGVFLFVFLRDFVILEIGYLLLFEAVYLIANSFIFKKLYPGNNL